MAINCLDQFPSCLCLQLRKCFDDISSTSALENVKNLDNQIDTVDCSAQLSIHDLSGDGFLHVILYLSGPDIAAMALINRSFSKEMRSDFIWEQVWLLYYGDLWTDHRIRSIRKKRGINWCPFQNKTSTAVVHDRFSCGNNCNIDSDKGEIR